MFRTSTHLLRHITTVPSGKPKVMGGMIVEAQQHGKLTDLKTSVLSLYRSFYRTSKDPKLRAVVTEEFRKSASENPENVQKIDFLLRQGHKKLTLVQTPGFRGVS
jgi:hypothetical protein